MKVKVVLESVACGANTLYTPFMLTKAMMDVNQHHSKADGTITEHYIAETN